VGRDGEDEEVICVKSEPEYFCEGGWTGGSLICVVGQNQLTRGTVGARQVNLKCTVAVIPEFPARM
jgi:hypothetical protein